MARSKVELFEAIRRDHRREGLSIRGLADRYGVHRLMVRQALDSAEPPPRKTPVRAAPRLDPAKPLIDAMLTEDLDAPRKQRHTARRVLARLVDEHSLDEITYSTVRDYVRVRRVEIWAAAGRSLGEVFVPQTHEPGAEAEVDFADLWIILAGVKTKVFLFTFRLSFSGKAVHRAFATQSQEAFLEWHVAAFAVLGGVPVVHVRYDNLKAAVSRVLSGRNRLESARWVSFRSHYGFDAFYCCPGREGAHEKGGVEGEGGRFRRTHLVPMPQVDSLAELNILLAGYDERDNARRIADRTHSVGHDFVREAAALTPLPAEAFETGVTLWPRVDRYARVTVRQCRYSVPAKLIGRRVRVLLRATEVLVFDGARALAAHPRATVRGSEVLNLDHYLEVLARKPGALPGATALAQARAAGSFTAAHEAFWAAARTATGSDAAGTRVLIEVLLLHRRLPASAVIAGMTTALALGVTNPELVTVEARRAATIAHPATTGAHSARVLTLPERPLTAGTALPVDERPLPTVTPYDQLLRRRDPAGDPAGGLDSRTDTQGEAVS
ncbi:MAG: IS21 family transposase [Pseudonocardiaceae bacterium]